MGCGFFSPVNRWLDCFPPVYREAGCHIGCHSAGSQSVAPLCRPTFGGTFGKDEPDHLFFWRQASNHLLLKGVSPVALSCNQVHWDYPKAQGVVETSDPGNRFYHSFFKPTGNVDNRDWIADLFMTLSCWLFFESILHQLKGYTMKESMYFHFPNLNHLWKFFRLSFIPTGLTLSLGMT